MSVHARKPGGQKDDSGNDVSHKVRKMKEKQKQWMQEREFAKVSETKSAGSMSPSRQHRKQRSSPVSNPEKSSSLTWISKDDYQSSMKRSRTKHATPCRTTPQTEGRMLNSREPRYSSFPIKSRENDRSRGSRVSETSITGFDEGQQKSTRAGNSNGSPGHNQYAEHFPSRPDSENSYLGKNLSSESFNALADKIAERMQIKEKSSNEISESMPDSETDKPMTNHVCSVCKTLMAPPQHSPIAIIPCGHTFCQICVSNCSKCPQCQAEVFSTAPNTVMQQIIEDFRKKQEKERLRQLEEQTRKYVEEYQNLNLRCEGLAGK